MIDDPTPPGTPITRDHIRDAQADARAQLEAEASYPELLERAERLLLRGAGFAGFHEGTIKDGSGRQWIEQADLLVREINAALRPKTGPSLADCLPRPAGPANQ